MGAGKEADSPEVPAREGKSARSELVGKVVTPIVVGLLMALGGFITQWTVLRISSQQENARLITELQIQREQAESDLRKGIFDKAFDTLLTPQPPPTETRALSDRLLKLELLSLNFGDTLSLSPLFAELRRDLDRNADRQNLRSDEKHDLASFRARLESLARRVASAQLTSVAQYGVAKDFRIPLDPNSGVFTLDAREFRWPDDQIAMEYGSLSEDPEAAEEREIDTLDLGIFGVDDTVHRITLTFQNPSNDTRTVVVDIEIKSWKAEAWNRLGERERMTSVAESSIERRFTLDFFNFPKIDNTRLFGNQRFSVVLERFDPKGDAAALEIAAVVFPSEYASLRDRPGMNEAVSLMNRVVQKQEGGR